MSEDILSQITAFRDRHSLSPSAFGVLAVNSANLVHGMMKGRQPRSATVSRLRTFMAEYDEAQMIADQAQLELIRRCGFVTVEIDGAPRLESETQLCPKSFKRMVATGLLTPSGDALFGAPSQTYRPA
jgi:hypothetical protein